MGMRVRCERATKDAIQRFGFSVVPRVPYSQDLAPNDFQFSKLKRHLKDSRFSCDEQAEFVAKEDI